MKLQKQVEVLARQMRTMLSKQEAMDLEIKLINERKLNGLPKDSMVIHEPRSTSSIQGRNPKGSHRPSK